MQPELAPDAGDDIIHHVAFDHPGRPQLWLPELGRAFAVEVLGKQPGVGPDMATYDLDDVEEALQAIVRVSGGDVGWVWAAAARRRAEITLEIVDHVDFWPEFRGGLCYPNVDSSGVLRGARIVFTPWPRHHRIHQGALLHELAHGMLGFGHTPDRGDCHIMGSCPNGRDFSPAEYAAWQYMRQLKPGMRNPRGNPRALGTIQSLRMTASGGAIMCAEFTGGNHYGG